MKILYSLVNAILFYKNGLTSGCWKQEPHRQDKFVAIQFIDNDCGRHTLSVFCQKTDIFSQKKIGIGPVILQESN